MCKEILLQGKCRKKHIFSAEPPDYDPCRDYRAYGRAMEKRRRQDPKDRVGPEPQDPQLSENSCLNLQTCLIDIRTRMWECKICRPAIATKELNVSKIIMEAVNWEYAKGDKQADEVAVPDYARVHIRRHAAQDIPGNDGEGPADRRPRNEDRSRSHGPSPFSSRASSSDQQTGVVYNQEGKVHQRGVSGTRSDKAAELETLKGEWWMLHNNPDISEEMRQDFLPYLEQKDRVLGWAKGVRKPSGGQPQ